MGDTMLTLNAEILSTLIDAVQFAGIYDDILEGAIAAMDGVQVGYTAPVDLVGCDYPTQIVLVNTANGGDRLTVEYCTNVGTDDARTHIAGHVYLSDLA
jgi:hypothetical protein